MAQSEDPALPVLVCRPQPWMRDGACRGSTGLMFDEKREDAARRVCSRCYVQAHCLDYAMALGASLDGVWAGLSAKDRAEKRRARRAA